MSNIDSVRQAIAAGHTIRPDIARHTGLTESQVQSALQNLQYRGIAKVVQHRGRAHGSGKGPSVYGLCVGEWAAEREAKPRRRERPTLASVWDLGARA